MDPLGVKGAVEGAGKIMDKAIPQAEQAGKNLEDHAVFGAYGIIADIFNRIQGANCPVDLTAEVNIKIRVTGKIGDLQVTVPEYEVKG